jgi:hypothetical protein
MTTSSPARQYSHPCSADCACKMDLPVAHIASLLAFVAFACRTAIAFTLESTVEISSCIHSGHCGVFNPGLNVTQIARKFW